MPPIGLPELLIVLVIVILIFGPKRLKNIGSELGNAIKSFRGAVKEREENAGQDEEQKVEQESKSDTSTTSKDSTEKKHG